MNNTTQELEAIQRMMVPDSAALQVNVRNFWDIQDKVLDAMENLAHSWFERRHVGTHAALEAAQRMCKAQTRPIWFVSIKTGLVVRSSGRWPMGLLVRNSLARLPVP